MSVGLQRLLNSRFAVGLALGIGRTMPTRLGLGVARFGADRIAARREADIARAIRANQWVLSGEKMGARELDLAVRQTLRHTAACLFTLYHSLGDEARIMSRFDFSPAAERMLAQTAAGQEPLVLAGVHLSNFDFAMRAAILRGMDALAIAMPESKETSGYDWQNDMRREAGVEVVPASVKALRMGVNRLREGRSVLTGLDRPLLKSKYFPRFFGRPAALPVMHIHLALKTDAPVVVVGVTSQADGRYLMNVSDPITMTRHPDKQTEITQNAETVLAVAEQFIRQAPLQWAMFYPVWPEALARMP